MTARKVLIIKPGYCETLDPETSGIVSLGDVLRTTVLLHLFKDPERYHVTWVTDPQAWPLLRGNPCIQRIIKINAFTPFQPIRDAFDVVINLEKDPGICSLADAIPAGQRFGFRFDAGEGDVVGHGGSEDVFFLAKDPELKRRSGRNWSQLLFEIVDQQWNGENYILGHYPSATPINDVGINYRIGSKYPLKCWPMECWHELARRFEGTGLSVSHQPEKDNVEEIERYIDWIGSCRLLVTNDSLGLHIAHALEKPVVALFGPTFPSDIPDIGKQVKIHSSGAENCSPCQAKHCAKGYPCMPDIPVDTVFDASRDLYEKYVGNPPR
jgi:heptosyltransferase II